MPINDTSERHREEGAVWGGGVCGLSFLRFRSSRARGARDMETGEPRGSFSGGVFRGAFPGRVVNRVSD